MLEFCLFREIVLQNPKSEHFWIIRKQVQKKIRITSRIFCIPGHVLLRSIIKKFN